MFSFFSLFFFTTATKQSKIKSEQRWKKAKTTDPSPCCPGEEAAPGPLCEFPGRGAEGGRSGRGSREDLLRLGQRGPVLQDAASAGHAWDRWARWGTAGGGSSSHHTDKETTFASVIHHTLFIFMNLSCVVDFTSLHLQFVFLPRTRPPSLDFKEWKLQKEW